jgi:cbb3-type cytochrome c oxidase subunit III
VRGRGGGIAAALVGAGALLLAAGCGGANLRVAEGEGSVARGKTLFQERCAQCHTLADAGAQGTIGPNLDESYAHPIEQGFDESSIRDLVRAQIAYAVEHPPTGEPGMPRDIVTGEDAASVARYVASVAGRPVVAAPDDGEEILAGDQLFTLNCAGCHILAAARATGEVGPSLDAAQPTLEETIQIVTNGRGAMPPFEGRLSEEQIQNVSQFVAENAGR